MRIIEGKYKGRLIPVDKDSRYRPITSKMRESLFSILKSAKFAKEDIIVGSNVLDLFSGTGIIAFEALSRGAKRSLLVDINYKYLLAAKMFASVLGIIKNIDFLKANIVFLPKSKYQYDLIFIDPPYYTDLINKVLFRLYTKEWMSNGAIIVVKMSVGYIIKHYDYLRLKEERYYGKNKLLILQYEKK